MCMAGTGGVWCCRELCADGGEDACGCCGAHATQIFANSQLVAVLYDLMADKQEDDEMVLQITYTFFRCLQHESTRDVLLNHTQVVSYFVDLLYDKNAEIRKMADQTVVD